MNNEEYNMLINNKTINEISLEMNNLRKNIIDKMYKIETKQYDDSNALEKLRKDIDDSIECLKLAVRALTAKNGQYIPSQNEKDCILFNERVQHIIRIKLTIGTTLSGYTTTKYYVDTNSMKIKIGKMGMSNNMYLDSQELFNDLEKLNIGGWKDKYLMIQNGISTMQGTEWSLKIYYDDKTKRKFNGNGAFPYNFDSFLKALNVYDYYKELL